MDKEERCKEKEEDRCCVLDSLSQLSHSLVWKWSPEVHLLQGCEFPRAVSSYQRRKAVEEVAGGSAGVGSTVNSNLSFLAVQYARVVLAILQDCYGPAKGEMDVDPSQPILLVELVTPPFSPSSCRFAFLLIHQLLLRRAFLPVLQARKGKRYPFKYVVAGASEDAVLQWTQHPSLRPLIKAKVLDFAIVDLNSPARAECDSPTLNFDLNNLRLLVSGEGLSSGSSAESSPSSSPSSTSTFSSFFSSSSSSSSSDQSFASKTRRHSNPVILVGNETFSSLPQDAFKVSRQPSLDQAEGGESLSSVVVEECLLSVLAELKSEDEDWSGQGIQPSNAEGVSSGQSLDRPMVVTTEGVGEVAGRAVVNAVDPLDPAWARHCRLVWDFREVPSERFGHGYYGRSKPLEPLNTLLRRLGTEEGATRAVNSEGKLHLVPVGGLEWVGRWKRATKDRLFLLLNDLSLDAGGACTVPPIAVTGNGRVCLAVDFRQVHTYFRSQGGHRLDSYVSSSIMNSDISSKLSCLSTPRTEHSSQQHWGHFQTACFCLGARPRKLPYTQQALFEITSTISDPGGLKLNSTLLLTHKQLLHELSSSRMPLQAFTGLLEGVERQLLVERISGLLALLQMGEFDTKLFSVVSKVLLPLLGRLYGPPEMSENGGLDQVQLRVLGACKQVIFCYFVESNAPNAFFACGRLLMSCRCYKEALKFFRDSASSFGNTTPCFQNMAICSEFLQSNTNNDTDVE